jgi:hypothetical protein
MKLQLTKDTKFAVETAAEEPFLSINRENGITKDAFLALLTEIDQFIPEFEAALGLSGAEAWIGERLHEAVLAGRTTVERHLTKQYFSEFDIRSDTAHILVENYETIKTRMGILNTGYRAYDFGVLRFLLTRMVHEDTHSHIHKTDYSALFAELVDRTKARIEAERPSARVKIKELPLDLTAPIYLKEREEVVARKLQRLAINAYLKAHYERDPERYELIGVPLFLPPHPVVVAELKRIAGGNVDFKNGFLSTYRGILSEYASAITTSEAGIYEEARVYLQSRTEELNTLAKRCVEGDYTGLKTIEREVVWKPGRGMKL